MTTYVKVLICLSVNIYISGVIVDLTQLNEKVKDILLKLCRVKGVLRVKEEGE